jgi:hypothetical protein
VISDLTGTELVGNLTQQRSESLSQMVMAEAGGQEGEYHQGVAQRLDLGIGEAQR